VTRFLSILVLTLFVIPSAQAQDFTDAQKDQIQKMFKEYLMENGELIIESVDKYQTKEAEETRKSSEVKAKAFLGQIEKQGNYPMTGNKDGDITLVEFFDYNCGYCRRALEELIIVLEKDKNLNVVFLDMPILGPASLEASKWSLAAHKQDKYFEFHSALLNHNGQKDEAAMEKIAKNLSLDLKKLKADKDSKEIADLLSENVKQAQEMNVRGTPGFIIDGQVFPGYMPSDRIFEILADIRKQKS